MPSSLHITHGVLSLDVGGLERIVIDLIRATQRQGHRISVICLEQPGRLATAAEAAGATVFSLGKPYGRFPAYIHQAQEIFTRLQPSVVHTHQIGAAWYFGQAVHLIGGPRVPVIHTEHGNHFKHLRGRWTSIKMCLTTRAAARNIDRFCCVSDEISTAVTQWGTVPRRKVEVVPNGISTALRSDLPSPESVRFSLGIPAPAPVVGTVGRLAPVKRQDTLIRAFKLLLASQPDAWLLLVGDGPERAKLEELARELGIAGRVCFAGYQACPEEYLQVMSVFSLTSQSEGFPVSLLEAWRAGIPVACTAVGGIPKIVNHQNDGLLFREGDSAAAAQAFARLLNDPALIRKLGETGQRKVNEMYSLDRMAAEYERKYHALLGHRAEAGADS